jgi:sodium/potassium/calcium exchanger 6
MIPLLAFGMYIRFFTKVSEPPKNIMFLYALISFVMSITWISFTSDIVVDLLDMLGKILDVPKPVLGLTLLAWGNCLGDMNADVAMTKKGFGEMAITGCMAGPIFNILIGLGASLMKGLIDTPSIPFSLFTDDKLNPASVLPMGLLCG